MLGLARCFDARQIRGMPTRLLLVRHGRSGYQHGGGWIDRHGIAAWRRAYDAAGIRADDAPPEWLFREARAATHLISSDLPRALESAQRLASGRQVDSSALLREIALPFPQRLPRMPLAAWGAAAYLGWTLDTALGRNPGRDAASRVQAAALWLASAASEGSCVVVTHGVFRGLLGDELLARGWTMDRGPQRNGHWSAWGFSAPATR